MNHRNTTPTSTTRSVLASLRALTPDREAISFDDALRIAELQATRLLELHGVTSWPVSREIISELPKIRILPSSNAADGANFWDWRSKQWVILLNRADSWNRQRFTLAHEYKHIIDHPNRQRLYHGTLADRHAEQAADYFAGCLLVPRRFLKRAWGNGIQRQDELARAFNVSEQAIRVRLRQTGLVMPTDQFVPRSCTSTPTRGYGRTRTPVMQGGF